MKDNDPNWTKVDGLIAEIWLGPDGQIVATGLPPMSADETAHNCDAKGCGQSHVLYRGFLDSDTRTAKLAKYTAVVKAAREWARGNVAFAANNQHDLREAVAALDGEADRG